MATKLDTRQSVNRSALSMIGSAANDSLDTILAKIDPELAKLYEDRNLTLADGGVIALPVAGTSVTFTQALKLHVNSQVAGGAPTVIDLASTTRTLSANLRMVYAVINRTAGTATVTDDSATLPAQTSANQEVVLIAKRIDSGDGTKRIYFRGGFSLSAGQSSRLGSAGYHYDSEMAVVDATDPTKKLLFDASGTTATSTTLLTSQTSNQILTLPDATDTLIGKATTDNLTNKTLQFLRQAVATDSTTTGANATLAAFTTGIVRLTNASLTSLSAIPAGVSGQQLVIENKTGVTVTLNNEDTGVTAANRLVTGTNAAVTLLNDATFIFTYDSTSSRWQLTGGSGSGSGSGFKNYLTDSNSKFEGGVQDWVTYKDAAASTPVDGTGGSPTVITISATSTVGQVLEGLKSLKIAKSAANGQGEGTSVLTKAIDRSDQGKPFFVYFSYDASDANFVAGDLQVFAYDVTNSTLLTVYSDTNNGQLLQLKGQFSGIFFTQDTTASIRLIVHCATTNATAYNVYMDEVVVTPQASITGPVVTDWVNGGALTFTAVTTAPTKGTTSLDRVMYRRVGDSAEIKYEYRQTGAGTAGSGVYFLGMPTGLTIDTAKINAQAQTADLNADFAASMGPASSGEVYNGTANGSLRLQVQDSTKFVIHASQPFTTYDPVGSGFFALNQATYGFSVSITVPILGWSSGASLTANDAGLQTTLASANKSAGAVTANTTIATWTNETSDNYQAFDPSTGIFTAPKTGKYFANFAVATTTGTPVPSIRVGGTILATGVATTSRGIVHAMLSLSKGDTVTFTIDTSLTLTTSTVDTRINIVAIPDFNVFGVQGPIVVGVMTDWTDGGTNTITATTTNPTKGTIAVDKVWYRRVGDSLNVRIEYRHTAAGTAGSGDYLFDVPGGYSVDLTKLNASSTVEGSGGFVTNNAVGSALLEDNGATTGASGSVMVYDTSHVRIGAVDATTAGVLSSAFYPLSSTSKSIVAEYTVPIVGWTSETRLYPTQRVIGTTYLRDEKAANTAGGTATSGSYATRTLNTQTGDTGFCSLSSNQFTLNPGTYEIVASAPAVNVNQHKIRLRNITASADAIIGTSALSGGGTTVTHAPSLLRGRIVVTANTTFEIQHRVTTTAATSGFGIAANYGDVEVYTEVKIDKIY